MYVTHMYDDTINEFYNMDPGDVMVVCDDLKFTNILTGCYKYVHKNILLMYLGSKHPLLSLPISILKKIESYCGPYSHKLRISSNFLCNYYGIPNRRSLI